MNAGRCDHRDLDRAPRPAVWWRALVAGVWACGCAAALLAGFARAQLFDAGDLSGEELFGRYCAACHGQQARGDGPVAPTLRTAPPNLRLLARRYDGEFPAAEVRQAIDGRAMAGAHGTREMPIWGYEFWVEEGADLTAEREARAIIDRIVDYLDSIQERPKRGGEVF